MLFRVSRETIDLEIPVISNYYNQTQIFILMFTTSIFAFTRFFVKVLIEINVNISKELIFS